MDTKNSNAKQTRKLYIALVSVLVCLSVIVGVTTAISKKHEREALLAAREEIENALGSVGDDPLSEDVFGEVGKPSDDGAETDDNKEENKPSVDAALEVPPENNENEQGAPSEDNDPSEENNGGEDPEGTHGGKVVDSDAELPDFGSPASGAVIVSFSDVTPVFSVTMNDYRVHCGVDVAAESGSAVSASADGVIGAIWDDPMMGKCISVVHSGGAVSTYKGVYDILPDGIAEGSWVNAGDVIAAVGDTALAEVGEESHVHYELSIGGNAVDPCDYIEFSTAMNYED